MVSDVSNLLRCSVFFLISLSQIVFTLSVFASRVKTVSEEQTASELKLSWQEDAGAETTKYWLSGSGSSTWKEFKIGILKIASCIHIQKKLYARPVVRHIIKRTFKVFMGNLIQKLYSSSDPNNSVLPLFWQMIRLLSKRNASSISMLVRRVIFDKKPERWNDCPIKAAYSMTFQNRCFLTAYNF